MINNAANVIPPPFNACQEVIIIRTLATAVGSTLIPTAQSPAISLILFSTAVGLLVDEAIEQFQ
ncbi:MAG: hypothetical protein GYA34_10545 [Chloroflexi bacterium]|nr:hypothetical protein [Chloroflexota bacterium]